MAAIPNPDRFLLAAGIGKTPVLNLRKMLRAHLCLSQLGLRGQEGGTHMRVHSSLEGPFLPNSSPKAQCCQPAYSRRACNG